MGAHIRTGAPTAPIIDLIHTVVTIKPLLQCTAVDLRQACKVMVNGIWIGTTDDPQTLHTKLRMARQYQDIPYDTTLAWIKQRNELLISTDAGAFLHPVLVRDKLDLVSELYRLYGYQPTIFWDMLMTEGVIEFLEKEEEMTYRVAMRSRDLLDSDAVMPYTHVQIHPTLMFGVCASLIPFPDHNQAPRNMYQCIDAREPIRMADGTTKPLGHVRVGDMVVTFDPETLEQSTTRVVNAFARPTDKLMVKITTSGGLVICATEDHLFMTRLGWRSASYLDDDTMLLISPSFNAVVWHQVEKVECVPTMLIADITTESSNHTFITASGFCVHNSSMGKQAIGVPASNYLTRPETKMQVLNYPQRPIVSTYVSMLLGHDELPSGENAVVAVACYTGYNQEDSVIVNKSALDRGMFRSMAYVTFKDTEKYGGAADREVFEKPDPNRPTRNMQHANYDKLNPEDGIIDVGAAVDDVDALIGKVMISGAANKKNKQDTVYRDRTTLWQSFEHGVVDSVMMSSSVLKEDIRNVRVRVRSERVPELGDKFSSRHGQKGVMGHAYPQEDMPFTSQGIVPDIIINPHCLPSRMTIAHLLEMITGKLCCLEGTIGDGTAFRYTNVEQIAEKLQKAGYERYGNEVMYNGTTGEQLENPMFIGVIHYQRLKHQTRDKVHARARGPRQAVTRQPNEGRSRDGGLRFGEMERDQTISHGAAALALDRMLEQSDLFETVMCRQCGLLAESGQSQNQRRYSSVVSHADDYYCRYCKTGEHVVHVRLPYAFKLLIQEMSGCHVGIRLEVEEEM